MSTIEVFKTNVTTAEQAREILARIQHSFPDYVATFDLEDCDKILRIKTHSATIKAQALISLLKNTGAHAEILPDEIPPYIGNEVLLSTH